MKISNALQVILMGWVVGMWLSNDLPLSSIVLSTFVLSLPMIVANIQYSMKK